MGYDNVTAVELRGAILAPTFRARLFQMVREVFDTSDDPAQTSHAKRARPRAMANVIYFRLGGGKSAWNLPLYHHAGLGRLRGNAAGWRSSARSHMVT